MNLRLTPTFDVPDLYPTVCFDIPKSVYLVKWTEIRKAVLMIYFQISLQFFQVCPSELAPSIWTLEPKQGSVGDQTSEGPRLEPVRVLVQSLVYVLAVKVMQLF